MPHVSNARGREWCFLACGSGGAPAAAAVTAWRRWRHSSQRGQRRLLYFLPLVCCLLLPKTTLATATIATVVAPGTTAVFQHHVEALLEGEEVFSKAATVEVSRRNSDTLLILVSNDEQEATTSTESGGPVARAVAATVVRDRVTSLQHHADETPASLNYKRALVSLLTPAQHSLSLAYHTQSGVLGTCEVRYEHKELKTLTWLDVTRCSHFTSERVLGGHNLPLLHLAVGLESSSSACEYQWREGGRAVLEGVRCIETLLVAPRYSAASQLLNATLTSSLTLNETTPIDPATENYMNGARETTDLTFQPEPYEDEEGNVLQLMEEVCSSEGQERFTAELLQKLSHLSYAISRAASDLPDLPAACPANVRRGVALAVAVVGGPRTLHFFVKQLAELSLASSGSSFSDDEYFFTLALRSLVNPAHHTRTSLPRDFFLRRENQIVYDELVDYLLTQTPSAIAGVATLLEGVSRVAPQLFQRMLQKCGPYLLPKDACQRGDYAEAVRLLRTVSGLSTRPQDYVTSLGPCFATDNVDVIVAAMDTLSTVDCDMQGVTELQRVGLDSPSDSEIRIAAYRGLVRCLPSQPDLIKTIAKALDPSHDDFSTQVASYVWSHIQSVVTSEDPSLISLRDLLSASDVVAGVPDPVWYDPRRHSRHVAHTVHLDARTSLTVTGDVAWGRYSPAPRALYLTVALHHDGDTHQLVQLMVRVTGLEAMLLSVPLVDELLHAAAAAASQLWATASRMAGSGGSRSRRDAVQEQITQFIEQVMTRIPAAYRTNTSSVELYLRLLDTHALHLRLEDLRYSSPLDALFTRFQPPLSAALVALAPLLDNTLTLATSSGVPLTLGVHGMAGVNTRAEHIAVLEGGIFNIVASGGVALWGRAGVGGARATPLVSHHLWAVDLPITASYQYEGEELRAQVRLPRDWPGEMWLNRRDTTLNGEHLPLRIRRSCLVRGGPLEVCWEARDGDVLGVGAVSGRNGWLTPYYRALKLPKLNPADPVNVTVSFPMIGAARMSQLVVDVGGNKYTAGLVTQRSPTPSFAITLNTPSHAYLLKGLAGSRESITQVLSVEASVDQDRYGLRLQLSMPQLVRQKVWSPSALITTPEGGEEEVVRLFLSMKEEADGFLTELTFQTLGPLTHYLDTKISSQVAGTVNAMDGKMKTIEVRSLEVTSSPVFSVELSGRVFLLGPPQGQGHFRVRWGGEGNQVEFSVALAPAITFLGVAQHEPGGTRGISFRVSYSALHSSIQGPMGGSLVLLVDGSRLEVDLSLALAHFGRINLSHKHNGALDFQTAVAVRSEPLGVAWSAGQLLLVQPRDVRHEFNVSWSEEPQDAVKSQAYYRGTSETSFAHSFGGRLEYPGQLVEVEQTLEEVQPGTYKSKLVARADPGRTLNADTFLITRREEHVFSYGYSNTLRLDTWNTPLSLMGSLNCVRAKCSLGFTADRSGDPLLDLKVAHNAAAGVSRTDAQIMVMQWVNGTVSLDTVHRIGYYDLKWRLALLTWQKMFHGRAEVNLQTTDAVVSEALLLEVLEDGRLGAITHAYNGTLRLDQEARMLFVRQEVRQVEGGVPVLAWAVMVEGSVGSSLLNSYHFFKGSLRTPVGLHYIAGGEAHSAVLGAESIETTLRLSAAQETDVLYLLVWEMDFKSHNATISTAKSRQAADTEETVLEEASVGTELMSLESFGRLKTPPTGEVELSVDCKQTLLPNGATLTSQKIDADVRLTLVDEQWEVGGTQGSLTWASNTYSFSGRTWLTQGQRSIGLVSYGAANNQTLKSSHMMSVVDPTQGWGRLVLALENEHLGVFPHSFKSSAGIKLGVGLGEAGQAQFLVLRTPAEAAINLALSPFLATFPGGNLFLKVWGAGVEGHAAWAHVKGGGGLKWDRGGRDLEAALNYEHPGAVLHLLELSLSFSISQPLYPPLILALAGRFNLNGVYHLALNSDCRSEQKHYLVEGAMQYPGTNGGLRVLLRKVGATHGSILACFFNDFALQFTGAYTERDAEQEVLATINTSLLPETDGYTLKLLKRVLVQSLEVVAFLAPSSASREWVYTYRIVGQMKRDIKGRLRVLVAEDAFTHHILQALVEEYKFFVLVVHNQFDEMELELKFLELWPATKITGTLLKGKDSQLSLTVTTPTLKHLVEGRLLFSSGEWRSAHSGSLVYTQRDKAGRIVPFKLELEAHRWNSNKRKYKLLLHKTVSEGHEPKELPFLPDLDTSKAVQYPHELAKTTSAITFGAALEVAEDPTSTQYKMTWETDDTASLGKLVLGQNPHGGSSLVQYRRQEKGVPKSDIDYLLEGNYRRVGNEVTLSFTLSQSSIGRPRAINFLHSELEGYTELLLDLFEEAGDQVILVVTARGPNLKFRIGQYGNTFLLLGYQREGGGEEDDISHTVQVENSGRTVEVWWGRAAEDGRQCAVGGVMLETPTMAPTYNMFKLCPTQEPYGTVQVLGIDSLEGPYLKVGQISGPGGLGLQVGSGRLRPLDTPPALTLTADVEREVLEVLTDWQTPSISRLEEEFTSRWTSLVAALRTLGYPEVRIEGGLDLSPFIRETEDLLLQAYNFTRSTSLQVWMSVVDDGSDKGEGLFHEVGLALVRQMEALVNKCVEATQSTFHAVKGSAENWATFSATLLQNVTADMTDTLSAAEGRVRGVVDEVTAKLERHLRPTLTWLQATLAAISYNDDQSLYALVSRVMGSVRARLGRREGLRGYVTDYVLNRVEKVVVENAHWDGLRARGSAVVNALKNMTHLSVVMPHQTALKITIATPGRMKRDLTRTMKWFMEREGPRLLQEAEGWMDVYWARARYLMTWPVYGEAMVFGWDQAISWDGRQVTPLLTDACRHLLVLLTQAAVPTAVTLHMENLDRQPREVFTFFSGSNVVTLDSQLRMTYNGRLIRQALFEAGELTMRWARDSAGITSTTGLSLECQLGQPLCRLAVSGEHFAGTVGLLGVFDYDNSTDFMTSRWEMPATEEEWVQSWRVGTPGQCSSQVPESHISPPHGHHCTDLFHSPHSPYRWCFRSVSPSPYLQTCQAGWECAAHQAFLHACSRHYHHLEPNLTCSSCMSEDGGREQGTEGLQREVVIITDFECWEDPQDLITALARNLNKPNKVMIRYTGRGPPSAGPFQDVAETVVDNAAPPVVAALNAALLDFSERALKSIILFDCEHPRCFVSSSAAKTVKLRETLLSLGVQLHVITMDSLAILDRESLTRRAMRQLIGLDGHTAYLLSHARKKKVKGKRNIRRHLEVPIGNTCAHLAVESDGSVFSLRNVKMEKKHHRRILQQLVALRVDEGRGADYLACRHCPCGAPCTLCRPPPPLVYLNSDDDNDDDEYDDDGNLSLRSRENRRRNSRRRP